jgi:hypothetical protein
MFLSENSSLKLPKFPIITRWGSWITFINYICENFDDLCKLVVFLKNILENKNEFNYIVDSELSKEIIFVKKYENIPKFIKNLKDCCL